MKRKVLKGFLIIVLIVAIQYPIFSYAINQQQIKNEKSFLTANEQEAAAGESVQLTLNLAQISYEDFEFTLSCSSEVLSDIEVEEQDIEIDKENGSIKITVEKGNLNIDKITLNYKIPKDSEIGTIITLTGTVKEIESEDDNQEAEEQTVLIKIKVIEKVENNENDNKNKQNSNEQKQQIMEQNQMNEKGEMQANNKTGDTSNKQESSKTTTSMKSASNSSSQGMETETNTYNGESNNYLKTLSIDGYSLTSEFSKTKTTYFVNVQSDIKSLTINAEAEDSNATVTIYGNDNLSSGQNKILIAVTAENGEVKKYRIYVN